MSNSSTPPAPETGTFTFGDADEGETDGVAASIHAPITPRSAKGQAPKLATPAYIAQEGYPDRQRSALAGLHFRRKTGTDPRAVDPPQKGTKRPRTHTSLDVDDSNPLTPSMPSSTPDDSDQAMDDMFDDILGDNDNDDDEEEPSPHAAGLPSEHDDATQTPRRPETLLAIDAGGNDTLVIDLAGFTTAPEGGFPKIHGWNKENVFEGVRADLRQMWLDALGPKFFVYPFAQDKLGDPTAPVSMIRAALASVFPGSNAKVGPPVRSEEARARMPICFMVGELDQSQVDAALDQGCFAYPPFTFFAIPFQPAITDYVCTLEHFTFGQDEGPEVLALIRSTIMNSKTIPPFLVKHNDAMEQRPFRNVREVLAVIAETAYVKPLEMGIAGGGMRVVWNVHVKSPTQDIAAHAEWVRVIASMSYLTPYNGAGRPFSFLACLKCKSIDHPTGLCPYPNIQGWLGPQEKARTLPATMAHPQLEPAGFSFPAPPTQNVGPTNGNYMQPPTLAPHDQSTRYAGDNAGVGYNVRGEGYGRGSGRGSRYGRSRAQVTRGYYTPM